ncbi:hypothetical protein EGH24_06630 [Halonotius terrestris]|uniref:Uncharacterized protein n=1 Tax=Halonotius terrestris TaxID=2487750 RepID=A0A8J8TD64_9EURY|nr:hypothetical protein [Halonotius terrestris]TQQ83103.1 hypothetical protein EGH24_06630 [Halonotius terrestris]
MGDDKNGRAKQAQDADNRQRARDVAATQARWNEPEPPDEAAEAADFESELDSLSFPTTGTEIVATVGDYAVRSADESYTIGDLIPVTEAETFDSPAAVRVQLQRPTVAAAMKQVIDASTILQNPEFPYSQRKAYEQTFKELRAIDADDDDEGIQAMSDWILGRIEEKGKLPGSRDVRRQAAKFCRTNGYQVRNDQWLGI